MHLLSWEPLCETIFYVFLCFSVLLALRLPCLGEERANLSERIWFCLFSLPLGVWEGLLLVTVAHPGLFSFVQSC